MAVCDDIKEKLSLYIEGEAEENQKQEIEAHIEVCAECRQYYNEMKAVLSELNNIEDTSVPKDVHNKIMNEVKKISSNKKKNKFKEILPVAACFIVMCIVTFALTDMQNKKALQREAEAQIPSSQTRSADRAPAQTYEKKTEDIIYKYLTVTVKSENNDKIFEIAEYYDPEAALNNDGSIEFSLLKYDLDDFMEKSNDVGETKITEESEENKTDEYNEIFEKLNSADKQDVNTINSLTEQAFFMEMNTDYYFVKLVMETP